MKGWNLFVLSILAALFAGALCALATGCNGKAAAKPPVATAPAPMQFTDPLLRTIMELPLISQLSTVELTAALEQAEGGVQLLCTRRDAAKVELRKHKVERIQDWAWWGSWGLIVLAVLAAAATIKFPAEWRLTLGLAGALSTVAMLGFFVSQYAAYIVGGGGLLVLAILVALVLVVRNNWRRTERAGQACIEGVASLSKGRAGKKVKGAILTQARKLGIESHLDELVQRFDRPKK